MRRRTITKSGKVLGVNVYLEENESAKSIDIIFDDTYLKILDGEELWKHRRFFTSQSFSTDAFDAETLESSGVSDGELMAIGKAIFVRLAAFREVHRNKS